ncbi:MAG: hypothetical protein BGO31_11070 [Bacteroidetes bacterium 43-16]|uniref:MauE/DoxX family redox-associated membrane protein n=1 Tax=uncultured Dysgonomonas sp. TaxID=206096 RepID=UPI00092587AA|nr:MauE/DoxX family redox-associated membrane protein [uncultured Dysgonomonas sp.]OJV51000.1 MAG: hypothetical protein BGO31_11070 [Bacteroidetes bacterium 43-16]
MSVRKILSEIFVYFIALLWLYTSVYKFLQLDNGIEQLSNSPFVAPFATWFGYGLPIIELALCVLLLFSTTRKYALYGSIALLTVFTIYIIVILNFYRSEVPCTCGGIISKLSWKNHIYFNLTFILMGILALVEPYIKPQQRSFDAISMKHT